MMACMGRLRKQSVMLCFGRAFNVLSVLCAVLLCLF